ncbi:hypothetical protein WR25_07728 isoform C [Diploscapter pachys]|uniref:Major sperm protein n=1 Tax=Diploscapter pachys TaxID=2018661 RepID=A0A2A2KJ81_9BILA|nr:hypothetical protein WR25_07728 isoform A [Diploscapter pachys]PAV73931.1 hypothetical protein WR25_07728 isoform B [Diploscapter pachys]PAV73932.1 hypothetical protein WR25_07728 isoform C [Diploscapter pachys]
MTDPTSPVLVAPTPPSSSHAPHMVLVNPLSIIFDEQNNEEKILDITDRHTQRIAWRVMSNSSCRYVVTPHSGFLEAKEAVAVKICLMDRTTYNPAHLFIVQAFVPGKDDNDKKEVWTINDSRIAIGATPGYIQNVRVMTEMPHKSLSNVHSPILTSPTSPRPSSISSNESVATVKSTSTSSVESREDVHKAHGNVTALCRKKHILAAKLTNLMSRIAKLEEDVKQVCEFAENINDHRTLAPWIYCPWNHEFFRGNKEKLLQFTSLSLSPDCTKPHVHFDKALLLSIFFGWLGLDRIYMGYYAIGLFKMFTVGGVVIFWMVDIVLIALQIIQPADGSPWLMPYFGPKAFPIK